MLSAYLPPCCGVCLVRVKKNGSNGFIVLLNLSEISRPLPPCRKARIASRRSGIEQSLGQERRDRSLPSVVSRVSSYTVWYIESQPFWPRAISRVREQAPGFVFIAEVYGDLEWASPSLRPACASSIKANSRAAKNASPHTSSAPFEPIDTVLSQFYSRLFAVLRHPPCAKETGNSSIDFQSALKAMQNRSARVWFYSRRSRSAANEKNGRSPVELRPFRHFAFFILL
jgi:hypothetical protein